KITDLKLFHNHMTIDLLEPLFGFGPEMWRLSTMFRKEIFQSFAKSNQYGMIFTFVWAFDQKEDWTFVEQVCDIFSSQEADIYFVELEADVDERLERNKTTFRLEQKPNKRNIKQSEQDLLETMDVYRLNSKDGDINHEKY